jgi:hypothetical protein
MTRKAGPCIAAPADRSGRAGRTVAVIALAVVSGLLAACSSTPPPQPVTPKAAPVTPAAPAPAVTPPPPAASLPAPAQVATVQPAVASATTSATTPAAPAVNAPGLTPSGEPAGGPVPVAAPKATAPPPPLAPDDAQVLLNAALKRAHKEVPPAAPTPAPTAPTVADKARRADSVVVVDNGDSESKEPKSLVEAARAERQRRATSERTAIVINDKTLRQYAKKGQITVAAGPPKVAAAAAPSSVVAVPAHDEQYWRHGALEIRRRWRSAYDRVKELEKSAADWRIRFYAQDDPYVRDGQIKPSWDRALEQLTEAQNQVDISKRQLADFLDQGRHEGALPGWLREGIEEEPPPPPKPIKPGDAIEPPILKDPGR